MLNFKILGHPINVITILLIIALFWLAMFALHQTGVLPAHSDGGGAGS